MLNLTSIPSIIPVVFKFLFLIVIRDIEFPRNTIEIVSRNTLKECNDIIEINYNIAVSLRKNIQEFLLVLERLHIDCIILTVTTTILNKSRFNIPGNNILDCSMI